MAHIRPDFFGRGSDGERWRGCLSFFKPRLKASLREFMPRGECIGASSFRVRRALRCALRRNKRQRGCKKAAQIVRRGIEGRWSYNRPLVADGVNPLILRLLDANANRAREGLRVVEDYARFVVGAEELVGELKGIRHRFAEITGGWQGEAI